MDNVNWIAAFGAGLLSFISPCVLPIVPGYLSFISGVSVEEMKSGKSNALRRVLMFSLSFVLGFSTVFILLGASATAVYGILTDYMHIISKVAGAVIIILGIHYLGLFKIKALNYEKRFQIGSKKIGLVGAYFVGFAFAFGWTPCIGPILAAILAIAAQEDTVWRGIILLSFYSAGLAIPFLLTGLAFNSFINVSGKIKKHFKVVEIVGGVFLILVGLMIFTDSLSYLSGVLSEWFPFLELG